MMSLIWIIFLSLELCIWVNSDSSINLHFSRIIECPSHTISGCTHRPPSPDFRLAFLQVFAVERKTGNSLVWNDGFHLGIFSSAHTTSHDSLLWAAKECFRQDWGENLPSPPPRHAQQTHKVCKSHVCGEPWLGGKKEQLRLSLTKAAKKKSKAKEWVCFSRPNYGNLRGHTWIGGIDCIWNHWLCKTFSFSLLTQNTFSTSELCVFPLFAAVLCCHPASSSSPANQQWDQIFRVLRSFTVLNTS